MASHIKLNGFGITLGKGGLRFTRKPSAMNSCVGAALRGQHGGGRYDPAWRAKFTAAVRSCSGRGRTA